MLVSIGDQVKPGTYRLHSVFKHAVNFQHRGRLISVVDETIGPGPLNIVLRALPAGAQPLGCRTLPKAGNQRQAPGTSIGLQPEGCAPVAPKAPAVEEGLLLRVGSSTVLLEGHHYRFHSAQRYCSRLESGDVDVRCFRQNLAVLREALRRDSPPKSLAFLLDGKRRKNFRSGFERDYAAQIQRGARLVFRGRLREGIGHLKGCGPGLTPGGDDFIAGVLIGLHLLQKLRGRDYRRRIDAVYRAARSSNVFSSTFLDLARRGWLFGRMKDLVSALVAGSGAAVDKAAKALFTVGETSGADLATGFFMTVRDQTCRGAGLRCYGAMKMTWKLSR